MYFTLNNFIGNVLYIQCGTICWPKLKKTLDYLGLSTFTTLFASLIFFAWVILLLWSVLHVCLGRTPSSGATASLRRRGGGGRKLYMHFRRRREGVGGCDEEEEEEEEGGRERGEREYNIINRGTHISKIIKVESLNVGLYLNYSSFWDFSSIMSRQGLIFTFG